MLGEVSNIIRTRQPLTGRRLKRQSAAAPSSMHATAAVRREDYAAGGLLKGGDYRREQNRPFLSKLNSIWFVKARDRWSKSVHIWGYLLEPDEASGKFWPVARARRGGG